MAKHDDLVGLLKYAVHAGVKQAAARKVNSKRNAVKLATFIVTKKLQREFAPEVLASLVKLSAHRKVALAGGGMAPRPTFTGPGGALSESSVSGFLNKATGATPGWAKALGLLGAAGLGAGAAWHVGNELQKRFDHGVDPEAKGIGMNRNLRNALTEQTAKATSWASELGGLQHAMRNAYAPLYQ